MEFFVLSLWFFLILAILWEWKFENFVNLKCRVLNSTKVGMKIPNTYSLQLGIIKNDVLLWPDIKSLICHDEFLWIWAIKWNILPVYDFIIIPLSMYAWSNILYFGSRSPAISECVLKSLHLLAHPNIESVIKIWRTEKSFVLKFFQSIPISTHLWGTITWNLKSQMSLVSWQLKHNFALI